MPPALQNPATLWLLLTAALVGLVYAFMRPELRWKAIVYGAESCPRTSVACDRVKESLSLNAARVDCAGAVIGPLFRK